MNIGEPVKVTEVPRPIKTSPIRIPVREPVRLPIKEPVRVAMPVHSILEQAGMEVDKLLYSCPHCYRELEQEDGDLSCPIHGLIYSEVGVH